jgi:leucyl-tRNA synthetase
VVSDFTILLSPYAPHIAEEIWNKLGNKESVTTSNFPDYNSDFLKQDNIDYPVSFNGKMRFKITLPVANTKEEVEKAVIQHEKTKHYLADKPLKKIIIVPQRIVNIVF